MLERVRLDLSDVEGRRRLFQRLGGQARKALIVSEGLIIYLTAEEVGSLASDLAAHETFHYWLLDITSPALLRLMLKKMGKPLADAAAPLRFAAADGPEFFRKFGWHPVGVRSMFHVAGQMKRLPLVMSFFYHLQKAEDFQTKRPWAGACLLEREDE